ncbi:PQQ-binding-like beta-propeller repeat protein [Patescibacteria group bacterium]
MRNKKKFLLIFGTAIFLFGGTVFAQLANSPSSTLLGNSKHTGLSKYETDIKNPALKWKFDAGDGIESSPAIGEDGTIYFGAFSDNFYALNPDGTEKWRFTREREHFRSSPTLGEDGTIYFLAVFGLNPQYSAHLGFEVDYGTPKLYALNLDGTVKWEFVLGGGMSGLVYTPTIGDDGTIYAISGGAKMPGAVGGDRLWAINPDGTEKWYFKTEDAIYSAPTLADDGTIYFGCADGNFYALNPDGTEKWRFNTGPGAKKRDDIYDSVPSIGLDGTVYVGSYDKNLYAFNPDGTVKWKFKMSAKVEATPSIGPDGTIYAGTYSPSDDKYLYALNPEDGSLKWKFETGQGVYGSPVIDANGILFFGSYDQYLYSLNSDGTERWRFKTNGGIVIPPVIDSQGIVYVGSWDNYLYAIGEGESVGGHQKGFFERIFEWIKLIFT